MALTEMNKLDEFRRYQAEEVSRHTSKDLKRYQANEFFLSRYNKVEAESDAEVEAFFASRVGKPKVQKDLSGRGSLGRQVSGGIIPPETAFTIRTEDAEAEAVVEAFFKSRSRS